MFQVAFNQQLVTSSLIPFSQLSLANFVKVCLVNLMYQNNQLIAFWRLLDNCPSSLHILPFLISNYVNFQFKTLKGQTFIGFPYPIHTPYQSPSSLGIQSINLLGSFCWFLQYISPHNTNNLLEHSLLFFYNLFPYHFSFAHYNRVGVSHILLLLSNSNFSLLSATLGSNIIITISNPICTIISLGVVLSFFSQIQYLYTITLSTYKFSLKVFSYQPYLFS